MNFSTSRLGLRRLLATISRYNHYSSSAHKSWQYEELSARSLIKARGNDSKELLQGVTTNDMNCLEHSCAVIYSMILNIKGRVLYDILIYKLSSGENEDPTYLIECDTSVVPNLLKHLKMYKLRKKVSLSDESAAFRVWALLPDCGPCISTDPAAAETCRPPAVPGAGLVCMTADPRVRCWSARLVLPTDVAVDSVVTDSSPAPAGAYAAVRYDLGIGEGVLDHPVGACLPLECNGALLNGVSFNKGCYLGQELTARTHHTGVVRKRLMPVRLEADDSHCAPDSPVLTVGGKQVGRLRGVVNGRGVGLLRLSALTSARLTVRCAETGREIPARTHIPPWWPAEVGVSLSEDEPDPAADLSS